MSNLFGPPVYVAGASHRLVSFTLSVTQIADDSGQLSSTTGVTGALDIGKTQLPVSLDMIDGQIAGGKTGSVETTGVDSFVASVPANEHSVVLELTEAGYTQQFDLWTLKRVPPSPAVLYRDPTSSSVAGTTGGPFQLSFLIRPTGSRRPTTPK